MARPKSKGLEYFSHDTDMTEDEKMQFIEAEHGLVGYAVYNKLLEIIYRHEGYFMVFNERYSKLLSKRFGIPTETLFSVVNDCINEGLFFGNLYFRFGILTSSRIQSNYVKACERRIACEFVKEYLLINPESVKGEKSIVEIIIKNMPKNVSDEETAISDSETPISYSETDISEYNGTQSKVKDSKVKDSIIKGKKIENFENDSIEDSKSVFDVESLILSNEINFEKIRYKTRSELDEATKQLHLYHLWLTEHEKYPYTSKQSFAGFEKWLTNSKAFSKNGKTQTSANDGKVGTHIFAKPNKEL